MAASVIGALPVKPLRISASAPGPVIYEGALAWRSLPLSHHPSAGGLNVQNADFALFNHLIRAGAAVAGYTGPEAADFPVKLAPEYIGVG